MEMSRVENHRLAGSITDFRKSPIDFLAQNYDPRTPGFRFRAGWRHISFIGDPEIILYILRQTEKQFIKNRFYKRFQASVGTGLGTSTGELWKRQRRLCQPAFTAKKLAEYSDTVHGVISDHLKKWGTYAESGAEFPLYQDMAELTMKSFLRSIFGIEADYDWRKVNDAFSVLVIHQGRKFDELISLPEYIPTPNSIKFNRALKIVHEFIDDLMRQNREKPKPWTLLNTLMTSVDDETKKQMTDKQLRDELITFMIGGYETSATWSTWTFIHLNDHPSIKEKVINEIRSNVKGEVPTHEELKSLPYLDAVLQESLRITPSAWMIARTAVEDTYYKGIKFKKGEDIFLSMYVTHRHPDYWSEPNRFMPERFLGLKPNDRAYNAYFPFGGGQRICIGNQFAMDEVKMLFAAILKQFDCEVLNRDRIEMVPALTLRPSNDVPAIAKRQMTH